MMALSRRRVMCRREWRRDNRGDNAKVSENSAVGGAFVALASGISLFITGANKAVGSTAAEETCADAGTMGAPPYRAGTRRPPAARAPRRPLPT